MKKSLMSLSVIAAAVFTAQVAVAQDAAPKTRAEVKAEAAAANKAGTIEKGAAVAAPTKATSDHSRAETKAEAAAANKSGEAKTLNQPTAVVAPKK